jgi:Tfp pilus assembly protein FimT
VNFLTKAKFGENDGGFSLVELCLLLGLTAIVAAFSVPMFTQSMKSMQLAADSRSIAAALSDAKLNAVAHMNRYQLSFDLTGNEWSLQRWNPGTNQFELQGPVNSLSNGIANSGIAFKTSSGSQPLTFPATSSTAITFNSRGIPIDIATGNPTGNNVVYLSNPDADYAVSVSLSGRVQLWKIQSGQWITQ